jgi:hypothetical protein
MKVKQPERIYGGRSKTCESSIRSRAVGRIWTPNRGGIRTRSIQHVITVLYRYNPWGTISWILKLWLKYKDGDCDGFYFTNDEERANPRSPKEDRRHTALLTSSTATDPAMSLKHVKENKLSTGDVLLKNPINAIVRDMMTRWKSTLEHSRLVFLEVLLIVWSRAGRPRGTTHEGEQGRTLRIQQT